MNAVEEVFRFAVIAKPARDNRRYFEWQTLDIVLFIGDNYGPDAEIRARKYLKANKLRVLKFQIKDQLIEERIKEDPNDEIYQKYMEAKKGGIVLAFQRVREFFSNKKMPPLLFPELDESFFDKVVSRVHGIRLPTNLTEKESIKSADYLVNDYIIELKFLLNDPFVTNQERIAQIFAKYNHNGTIDTELLGDDDKKEFEDVIMRPLSTHVQKASKQIKAVKEYLDKPNYHGFILLVNQAASALWGSTDFFLQRTIKRHSQKGTIEDHLTIELHHRSNGMDTNIETEIFPKECGSIMQRLIMNSFNDEFEIFMNEFAKNGFQTDNPLSVTYDKVIGENGELHSGYKELDNPYIKNRET